MLQEGSTVSIELIIYFHDYIIFLLLVIIGFVSYIFVLLTSVSYLDKYIVESHFLEFAWTVIPIVFLLLIAFPSLYLLYLTEDFSNSLVTIKAVAHQWYWEYEHGSLQRDSFDSYIITSVNPNLIRNLDVDNRLSIPVGLTSTVLVTSADVLHSWTVPAFGSKADAIPGRLNYLRVTPVQTGVFYGQCSELCGSNHSYMPIVVEVISSSDYSSG